MTFERVARQNILGFLEVQSTQITKSIFSLQIFPILCSPNYSWYSSTVYSAVYSAQAEGKSHHKLVASAVLRLGALNINVNAASTTYWIPFTSILSFKSQRHISKSGHILTNDLLILGELNLDMDRLGDNRVQVMVAVVACSSSPVKYLQEAWNSLLLEQSLIWSQLFSDHGNIFVEAVIVIKFTQKGKNWFL